jgi:hypothetical protein
MMIPEKLVIHYGIKKPKDRIVSLLDMHGSLDQQDILDKYNNTWRGGLTMYELRQLLRDKRFEKNGSIQFRTFTGRTKNRPIWRITA